MGKARGWGKSGNRGWGKYEDGENPKVGDGDGDGDGDPRGDGEFPIPITALAAEDPCNG